MVEVKDISKSYGDNHAVRNLTFKVNKGEIVGLLGPNGAGKSTTLNMLTGYRQPSSGDIFIGGESRKTAGRMLNSRIGWLPEKPPLYSDMRVASYLGFICELKKVNRHKRTNHLNKIMEMVKIQDVSGRMIRNLSKGYQQRIGIAQALIADPEIIILDEPAVGLDPVQIAEMRILMKKLQQNHTLILSSHILAEIKLICNRVLVLDKGVLIADDTPQNLENSLQSEHKILLRIGGSLQKSKEVVLSVKGVESVESESDLGNEISEITVKMKSNNKIKDDLFFSLAESRLPIYEMRRIDSSLEDVFIKMINSGD